MPKSVVDQVFCWLDLLVCWNLHGGGGNYFCCREHRIVQRAAQRILHEQLLQLKVGLRHGERLLVRGYGALCAYRFDGSETADVDLLLSVGQCLLRKRERFFFHSLVLVGIDEIPVHVLDLIDGSGNLQPESHVGKFAVVAGDADEASVGRKPKTLQKMLSYRGFESGVQYRAET